MAVSDGISCRVYDYKTGCNPPVNIQPAAQKNPSINDLFFAAFDRKTGKVKDKAARDKLNRDLAKPISIACSLDDTKDIPRIISSALIILYWIISLIFGRLISAIFSRQAAPKKSRRGRCWSIFTALRVFPRIIITTGSSMLTLQIFIR